MEDEYIVMSSRKHDELVAGLADVFAMMDEGYLVRDTSNDADPGFAMRQLPYVMRLSKARAALAKVQPQAVTA